MPSLLSIPELSLCTTVQFRMFPLHITGKTGHQRPVNIRKGFLIHEAYEIISRAAYLRHISGSAEFDTACGIQVAKAAILHRSRSFI